MAAQEFHVQEQSRRDQLIAIASSAFFLAIIAGGLWMRPQYRTPLVCTITFTVPLVPPICRPGAMNDPALDPVLRMLIPVAPSPTVTVLLPVPAPKSWSAPTPAPLPVMLPIPE